MVIIKTRSAGQKQRNPKLGCFSKHCFSECNMQQWFHCHLPALQNVTQPGETRIQNKSFKKMSLGEGLGQNLEEQRELLQPAATCGEKNTSIREGKHELCSRKAAGSDVSLRGEFAWLEEEEEEEAENWYHGSCRGQRRSRAPPAAHPPSPSPATLQPPRGPPAPRGRRRRCAPGLRCAAWQVRAVPCRSQRGVSLPPSPQPPGQRRGAPGALRRCAAAMAARLVRLLRLRKERTEGKGGGLQGGGGGKRRGLSGSRLAFSRAFCPASRAARVASRSHALLPAGPQQEARELGARGALRQAPLHQALRERLRSLQGLRASRGLRLVQVRALPWGAASSRPAPRLPCARPPPRISRAPAVPQGRSAVRVGTAARAPAGTSTGRFPVK